MPGIRHLALCLLTFCFSVEMVVAPCQSSDPPDWVWPLGKGIGVLEVKTNTTQGSYHNVQYMASPISLGSYETMVFTEAVDSFGEVNVPTLSQDDFAIQFYVYFDDIDEGTIISYLSDLPVNGTGTGISGFSIYVVNGSIEIEVKDYGIHKINSSSLVPSVWYHLALRRDTSKDYFSIHLNGGNELEGNSLLIDKVPLLSPGRLKFGGSFNLDDPFDGALACVQFFPCKDGVDTSHGYLCNSTNWPVEPTTTTSSTTSTTSTTTSTTSSTTSTTSTTTSTTSSTTSTTPTTTSTSTSTTSTTLSTTSPSLVSTTLSQNLFPAMNAVLDVPIDACAQFERIAVDAAFENSSDVMHVENVTEIKQCALLCVGNSKCLSFTVKDNLAPLECKLSFQWNASNISETGSMMYQLR